MFQIKVVENIKKHFIFSKPPPENRATCNTVELYRPQTTIQHDASALYCVQTTRARSYVDEMASHGLVWLGLLSVHQREARKVVKDRDTCSSDDTQCWHRNHGVHE